MRTCLRRDEREIGPGKLFALVLAGGNGTRLKALTRDRAKPAVPFGAHFRIVDFTLSNCLNSGLDGAAILTQYRPQSLIRHVRQHWQGNGISDVHIWPAGARGRARYDGTADAVYQNRERIEAMAPEHLLVVAGDHVYAMDYAAMLEEHEASGADATVSCVEVPVTESRNFGIVEVDRNLRMRGFTEKPERAEPLPGTRDIALASMGIYLFRTRFVLDCLEQDAADPSSSHDFGHDLLPRLVETADVRAHLFRDANGAPGYWRDVGTVDSYWAAHHELLKTGVGPRLENARWPIRGADGMAAPVQLTTSAHVGASQLGAGAFIAGTVAWSVVSRECRVEPGSTVTNSVLLPGATIGRDCRLDRVIVDSRCRIPDGTVIDPRPRGAADRLARRFDVSPSGIVLVTQDALDAEAGLYEQRIA